MNVSAPTHSAMVSGEIDHGAPASAQRPPKTGFWTRDAITGMIFSLIWKRCPKSHWVTTEYSRPNSNLTGNPLTVVVFVTAIETGTFQRSCQAV